MNPSYSSLNWPGDKIIDAVNCGGPAHTDAHGVRYKEDLGNPTGTASDHGKRYLISRVRGSCGL